MEGYMTNKILPCKCGEKDVYLDWFFGYDDFAVFCRSTKCLIIAKDHDHAYQAINEWNRMQMREGGE